MWISALSRKGLGIGVAVRGTARAVRKSLAPRGLDGQTIRFFGDAAGARDDVVQVVSDVEIALDVDLDAVFLYGAYVPDVLSVDYNAVTAAAIGAIQDLQDRVARLERM